MSTLHPNCAEPAESLGDALQVGHGLGLVDRLDVGVVLDSVQAQRGVLRGSDATRGVPRANDAPLERGLECGACQGPGSHSSFSIPLKGGLRE